MALTSTDIARKIFETLRDSGEILGRCMELYGRPATIFLGASGKEGPPPDLWPAFEVVAWGKVGGENHPKRQFPVSIYLTLEDGEILEDDYAGQTGAKVYRGPEVLEGLLDLALTAIREPLIALDFEDITVEYDPIEYFPTFVGVMTLTLAFPVLAGGFEPKL